MIRPDPDEELIADLHLWQSEVRFVRKVANRQISLARDVDCDPNEWRAEIARAVRQMIDPPEPRIE